LFRGGGGKLFRGGGGVVLGRGGGCFGEGGSNSNSFRGAGNPPLSGHEEICQPCYPVPFKGNFGSFKNDAESILAKCFGKT